MKLPLIGRRLARLALPISAATTRALEQSSGPKTTTDLFPPSTLWLFNTRSDDIFIASYPKSGATLMQMMLYQLTTEGEMDFPHIACVSPLLDDALRFGDSLESFPAPRLLKTHARRELLAD